MANEDLKVITKSKQLVKHTLIVRKKENKLGFHYNCRIIAERTSIDKVFFMKNQLWNYKGIMESRKSTIYTAR